MKKTITIFFLFIISIQCLPVKELGKCLFDSTFVEEEMCKKGIDKKDFSDNTKEFFLIDFSAHLLPAIAVAHVLDLSSDLHPAPASDVTTPPPNFSA